MTRTIVRFEMYTGTEEDNTLRMFRTVTRGIKPDANRADIMRTLAAKYGADEITCTELFTCDVDE